MNENYDIPVELIDKYPLFEANQVLTSTHLNEMRDYLDQQDRLTRTRLMGTGIFYGLEISVNPEGTQLEISGGAGVSTEGHLIFVDPEDSHGRIFTRYRKFEDERIYNPFYTQNEPNQEDLKQIDISELLPELDSTRSEKELKGSVLKDKVVVLYLDVIANDLKTCFSNSCDDRGKEREFTIRKLLVKTSDLDKVISGSFQASSPLTAGLADLRVPKPELKYQSVGDIVKAYNEICSDELIYRFSTELNEAYRVLNKYLDFSENPFLDTYQMLLEARDNQELAIQYFYSLLVDITFTFRELRVLINTIDFKGRFEFDNFPKHIVLGSTLGVVGNTIDRHYQEILEKDKVRDDKVNQIQWYLKRIELLITNYKTKGLNELPIKITPGHGRNSHFGLQSIPFYYEPLNIGQGDLYAHWHPEKLKQGEARNILSYWSPKYNEGSDSSTNPLRYDHSDYQFLRIEGHIGLSTADAKAKLNEIRNEAGLSFDFVSLNAEALSNGRSNPSPEELAEISQVLGYHDLQEDYFFHRLKLIHTVEDIKNLVLTFLESNREEVRDDLEIPNDELDVDTRLQLIFNRVSHLIDLLPPNLFNFDYEKFKDAYKDSLQDTIDYVLIENNLIEELYYELHYTQEDNGIGFGDNVINQAIKLVFRVFDRLFYTRLLHIYAAFKARIPVDTGSTESTDSLGNEGSALGAFLKKHRGLEHLGGVNKSGTFVILSEKANRNAGASDRVVADFALPYRCCGGGSGGGFAFDERSFANIHIPPFARPDYVIISKGGEIRIDILDNDYRLFEGGLQLNLPKSTTDQGGRMDLEADALLGRQTVHYRQKTDFVGIDKFQYVVRNMKTGLSDTGNVTVVIRDILFDAIDDYVETTTNQAVDIKVLENDSYDRDQGIELQFRRGDGTYTEWIDGIEYLRTRLGARVQLIQVDPENPFFNYDPASVGEDSFKYRIYQNGHKSIARVHIKVINATELTAVGDSITTMSKTIDINVLENDIYDEAQPIDVDFAQELEARDFEVDSNSPDSTNIDPLGNDIYDEDKPIDLDFGPEEEDISE